MVFQFFDAPELVLAQVVVESLQKMSRLLISTKEIGHLVQAVIVSTISQPKNQTKHEQSLVVFRAEIGLKFFLVNG